MGTAVGQVGIRVDALELNVAASMGGMVHGPQRDHCLEVVVGARATLIHRGAHRARLFLDTADTDADDQSTTTQDVDTGKLFGQQQRIVLRQEQDAGR